MWWFDTSIYCEMCTPEVIHPITNIYILCIMYNIVIICIIYTDVYVYISQYYSSI